MVLPPDVSAALDEIVAGAAAHDLESDVLDFKTVGRSVDDALTDLAEAAACFAGARGGTIVVGVRDRPGGADAFVGCDVDVPTVRHQIFERTEPGLTVGVERHTHPAGEVLVIQVPEGATLHAVKGRYTERVGASCMPMNAARIERVMADRRGDDWSAHPTDLRPPDADPIALAVARRFLTSSVDPRRQAYARLDDPALLRTLGVVTTDGFLNRAGALLFADGQGAELLAYSHRRTPTGALTASEAFTAPLVVAIDRVLDLISARVDRTSVNTGGGVQVQVGDLPDTAVREALVNAVMHRDYRDLSRVTVEHAATRLAVTSPGPFMSGISTTNVLTAASRSRNPRLAEAVRKLGLAETAGTGVDRMYAAMTRLGHAPPVFESDEATVRVTLIGGAPNEYLTRYVAGLPPETSDDADTMLTLFTLLQRKTVTAAQMVGLLQKSEQEVQTTLDRLAAPPLSLLEPTRESSRRTHPTYRLQEPALAALGPAVAYRRRTLDSADRTILELVREAGTINARMVRLMLDTDTVTTSRLLADLVERGWLVKTSRATRGPAVTYGPGALLPKKKSARNRLSVPPVPVPTEPPSSSTTDEPATGA